jgi:glycosyltransferase involved in cell wall biosynthesis
MIGSGPDKETLEAKAALIKQHRIIFTGFVDPIELPKYYAATDIYVHPAMVEPHSLAISEAIYMGCPVIISNTCGSWGTTDDVQPGKNGFVYKWGDIQLLGRYLVKLSGDETLHKEFSNYSIKISRISQQSAHKEGLLSAMRQFNFL